jgi:predicted MFS family arabinose efflux permease
MFNGTGQFFRFAAADLATPDYRSRAISWVLAGGVLAAFLGPNLANFTRTSFDIEFIGSYGALLGVYLLGLTFISALRIPPPSADERASGGRSLGQIASQPTFIIAVLAATVGYGVMNLVMTATPLAMDANAHSFGSTALVIQWHILGMFVPSFFTGHLIRYFGVLKVMLAGGVILLGCVVINLIGVEVGHFLAALLMLGLGWNFLYIGASTLLTETYTPAEKAKTQALHDFIVFSTVTVTAFSAGAVHNHFGWEMINLGVLPLIALTLIATSWLFLQRRRVPA